MSVSATLLMLALRSATSAEPIETVRHIAARVPVQGTMRSLEAGRSASLPAMTHSAGDTIFADGVETMPGATR